MNPLLDQFIDVTEVPCCQSSYTFIKGFDGFQRFIHHVKLHGYDLKNR